MLYSLLLAIGTSHSGQVGKGEKNSSDKTNLTH